MVYDYIIVGQGVAGTVLAESLLLHGKKVMVVDSGLKNTSSKVAAGIFNPITGRRMVKTWMADKLFPKLFEFYPALEHKLGVKFFYPKDVFHPFDSQEKQNFWMAESANPKLAGYIKGFDIGKKYKTDIKSDFGGMFITKSGYVDIPKMLDAYRSYLRDLNSLIERELNIEEVEILPNGIKWQEIETKRMIFCEGVLGKTNPYFDWLKYKPVKGELLVVDFGKVGFDEIINRGCWILPHHDKLCRVGATYSHDMDTKPTEKAKKSLIQKLESLTSRPFKIIDQKVGIRPATYDRRPFIGLHPANKSVGVFNGLGAKGVSLAPWCADCLIQHIEKGIGLPYEIDILRLQNK